MRTGLPVPTWRKLYGGVLPGKSTTAQVTDSCGMLEAYAEVDKALADLNGNTAAFRASEDAAYIEGMNQEFADTLFRGNEGTEPEAFTGFGPRFNTLTGAANSDNMLNGGGANGQTDCTSIWLVIWGPNTAHCIYPKGSQAGLKMTDKGQVTIENVQNLDSGVGSTFAVGGRMEAYRTHYRWDCGLTVRDWRYVVRIHSIDSSTLTKDASAGSDLINLLTRATELPPNLRAGRAALYGNRTIKSFLRQQMVEKVKNATLTLETVAGKHVMMFDGIPFRRCDQLTNTETSLN